MAIKQFRDSYLLVSEDGFVMNMKTGYIQQPKYNLSGYARVSVGKKGFFLLSRVVAETFIPNPLNLPQVDHIDRNPRNNHVSNLRWVSSKENLENRKDYKNSPFGIKYIHKSKYGKFRVRKPGVPVKYFDSLDEAKDYLAQQLIS
jgi:hypothetical protein